MKMLSRKSGFSLVELLTVIAIIAILAAIIFPVMGSVRDRARQNQCMTNLKQVALMVQAYKTDNRKYPDTLGPKIETDRLMEQAKLSNTSLFPEYINTVKMFHCPNSKVTNTEFTATHLTQPYDSAAATVDIYAYDSYDCYLKAYSPSNGTNYPATDTETRYTTSWVPGDETAGVAWLQGASAPPPDGVPNSPATAEEDYSRQLKFRNPPGNTVVTWCSNHETTYAARGNALVVFLDGHADVVPAARVESSKWRVRPNKS